MVLIDPKLQERKCPMGSKARHAQHGDVDVLEVRGNKRLVLITEIKGVELVRSMVELGVVELREVSPVQDLRPPVSKPLASVLPFRVKSSRPAR